MTAANCHQHLNEQRRLPSAMCDMQRTLLTIVFCQTVDLHGKEHCMFKFGICAQVSSVEEALAQHLKDVRKKLGCSSISYVSVNKDSHLLEVPEVSPTHLRLSSTECHTQKQQS